MQFMLIKMIENFSIILFFVSIISAVFILFSKSNLTTSYKIQTIFACYLFFNIGINYLFNSILHLFFADAVVEFLGWSKSPFELEIGFACLGYSITGFISIISKFGFRFATILAPAIFLLGTTLGHIDQIIISSQNYKPSENSLIFLIDIFIHAFGFLLLYLQHKYVKQAIS